MASDLKQSHDDLAENMRIIGQINDTLAQSSAWIDQAVQELRGFDDAAASAAIAMAHQALDDINNVRYGWLDSYLRRAEELQRRIAN